MIDKQQLTFQPLFLPYAQTVTLLFKIISFDYKNKYYYVKCYRIVMNVYFHNINFL